MAVAPLLIARRRLCGPLLAVAASALCCAQTEQAHPPATSADFQARAATASLRWDAESKSYDAKPEDSSASFEFTVSNPSAVPIEIRALHTSCGCTVAHLPPLPDSPLVLAPQASTTLRVSLDLTGKIGAIAKTVTVESSVGFTQLHVRANIPARPATGVGNLTLAREKNIEIAFADRQAVFRGDCMKCHATPAKGKLGEELYLAACTLCHDASPRASMIPDLNSPRGPRDLAFWMKWIGEGGPGTMMPAFAAEHGGPLNEEQICSLARYAYDAFPKEPLPPAGDAGAKTP